MTRTLRLGRGGSIAVTRTRRSWNCRLILSLFPCLSLSLSSSLAPSPPRPLPPWPPPRSLPFSFPPRLYLSLSLPPFRPPSLPACVRVCARACVRARECAPAPAPVCVSERARARVQLRGARVQLRAPHRPLCRLRLDCQCTGPRRCTSAVPVGKPSNPLYRRCALYKRCALGFTGAVLVAKPSNPLYRCCAVHHTSAVRSAIQALCARPCKCCAVRMHSGKPAQPAGRARARRCVRPTDSSVSYASAVLAARAA